MFVSLSQRIKNDKEVIDNKSRIGYIDINKHTCMNVYNTKRIRGKSNDKDR